MAKRLLILTGRLGTGDDELGRILMKNFLYSVARDEQRPVSVTFVNEGVRLACEGSSSLDDLRLLVDAGVDVRACGTCLDMLGLMDALAVGEVGTMPVLAAALLGEDGIVTIA